MKKKLLILFFLAGLLIPVLCFSQNPPPPPPGHGQSGNVPVGGAPIGSGILILLVMGSVYGTYKGFRLYQVKRKALLD